MRNTILETFPDEEFMFMDGFDEAIIGIDTQSMRIVYSVETIMQILGKDMSNEDAIEYFDFNIDGAYLGDKTPIYCRDKF